MFIGIDIGGTSVKYGLVDSDANILNVFEFKARYINGDYTLLQDTIDGLDEFLREESIKLDNIEAIGISATGQISDDGKVIGTAGHIPNWLGVDIKKEFEDRYNKPVSVINDANSMVVAEKRFGAAKGCKHVVGITIGTGVGGGIIVNNQLLTGADGIAGEVGHILINECDIIDNYNRAGSYEDAASTTVLVNSVKKLGYKNVDGKVIFNELIKNDDVKIAYDKWLNNITRGLVSLIHIFNPEIIVIGGGVSVREEFISELKSKVLHSVMPSFSKNLKFEAAKLGNNAGLLGAISSYIGE